jgi:hypothetical protein
MNRAQATWAVRLNSRRVRPQAGRDLSRGGGSAGGSEALGQGGGRELAVLGDHGLHRVHAEQAAEFAARSRASLHATAVRKRPERIADGRNGPRAGDGQRFRRPDKAPAPATQSGKTAGQDWQDTSITISTVAAP